MMAIDVGCFHRPHNLDVVRKFRSQYMGNSYAGHYYCTLGHTRTLMQKQAQRVGERAVARLFVDGWSQSTISELAVATRLATVRICSSFLLPPR